MTKYVHTVLFMSAPVDHENDHLDMYLCSHVHLADRTLSIAAIEKKKKKDVLHFLIAHTQT